MPNRQFPKHQYPDQRGQSASTQEWDALKGELEGLLDQVHGQIAEFEHRHEDASAQNFREPVRRYGTDDGRQFFMRHDQHDNGDASPQNDARREDALRQVQSAVARMGRKQKPIREKSQDSSRLDEAVEQLKARQASFGAVGMAENPANEPQKTPEYVHNIMQQMEGLHRSVRDLANQNLQTDPQAYSANFAQIEKRINFLAEAIDAHSDPAMGDVGARLDQLMKSTERLAEIQIKQLSQFEDFKTQNAPKDIDFSEIEAGIHNLYERLDAIERSSSAPSKELDTIARSVAGIASAVGHLQQENVSQQLPEIFAQLEQIGQRISVLDDEHSTRVTDHIRREMQGVRSQVTEIIEPRFTSLENRIEGLQQSMPKDVQPTQNVDLSELKELESRLSAAITSLDDFKSNTDDAPQQNGDDVLAALVAMEDRLNNAISTIDNAKQKGNAPQEHFFQSLKGMEDRIVDAIQSLRSGLEPAAPIELPALDLDGLKHIENRLQTQLDALDQRLQSAAKATYEEPNDSLRNAPTEPREYFSDWQTPTNEPVAADPAKSSYESDWAAKEEQSSTSQEDSFDSEFDRVAAGTSLAQNDLHEANAEPEREETDTNVSFGLSSFAAPAEADADVDLDDEPAKHNVQMQDLPEEVSPSFDDLNDDLPPPRSSFEPEQDADVDAPKSLSDLDQPAAIAAEPTPEPTSSFGEIKREKAHGEHFEQNDAVHSARQSFIAAARTAALSKQETPDPTTSLLGRAFARIKAGKDQQEDDAQQNTTAADVQVDVPAEKRLNAGENHLHKAGAEIANEADDMADAAEARRKRFLMPFGAKDEKNAKSDEDVAKPKSSFETTESVSLDGHPDYADDADDDNEETHKSDSFLRRNFQPILLGASIIAIMAMSANLFLGQTSSDSTQPPAQGEMSAPAEADVIPDVGALPEAPRQIDMAQVAPVQSAQLSALTDQGALENQDVSLVAPMADTAQLADEELTTASISPTEDPAPEMVGDIGPEAMRIAAAGGDVRAQFEIAAILMEGQAVPKDSQAAAKWFEMAAAAGYAPAQYRLAAAFEHGIGMEKNVEQAKIWYKRAAENGNRMAMHNLAALYASANEENQDFPKAAVWFERAAQQGVVDSQFNLGMLYARGLGVEQDLNQSYLWFALAAQQGDKDAQGARDDVARSIEANDMQELKAKIADWQSEEISLSSNYAPIGTWDPEFNPGPEITQKEVILGVQTALSKLGFAVGQPDGMMGPNTRDAIRGFERALGMNESGAINPRLMAILSSQPV